MTNQFSDINKEKGQRLIEFYLKQHPDIVIEYQSWGFLMLRQANSLKAHWSVDLRLLRISKFRNNNYTPFTLKELKWLDLNGFDLDYSLYSGKREQRVEDWIYGE